MNVRVAGHQVDTGEALQSHVTQRVEAMAGKYFDRAIAANVTFGRGPYDDFTCDIVAPVAQGMVLKASNRAPDAHVAFEGAAEKIERQLARYVDRLKDRKGNGSAGDYVEDAGYVIFEETRTAPCSMRNCSRRSMSSLPAAARSASASPSPRRPMRRRRPRAPPTARFAPPGPILRCPRNLSATGALSRRWPIPCGGASWPRIDKDPRRRPLLMACRRQGREERTMPR